MKIPTYWVRLSKDDYAACGWSMNSEDEARAMAQERLERIARHVERGESPERYPYGRDAIREWCVERYHDDDGEVVAALTRNGYGAWVLNAAHLMMADIDLPKPRKPLAAAASLLGRLFGRKESPPPVASPEDTAMTELDAFLEQHPHLGARVYRTRAGLRYLFTHGPEQGDDPTVLDLLRQLKSDPLYVRLCQSQQCFRARLSPKPWRCGLPAAQLRYPWADAAAEQKFQRWDQQYQRKAEGFATCRYLRSAGHPDIAAELRPLVALHDRLSRADSDLPLA